MVGGGGSRIVRDSREEEIVNKEGGRGGNY